LFVVFLVFAEHEELLTVILLFCQLVLSKDKKISTTVVHAASSLESPKSAQEESSLMGKGGEQQFGYQPNVYASQPQAFFSGG